MGVDSRSKVVEPVYMTITFAECKIALFEESRRSLYHAKRYFFNVHTLFDLPLDSKELEIP